MQDKKTYEYAVVRLVPRVDREEFLNVGIVLYAAGEKFLQVKFHINEDRLRAFFPNIDIEEIKKYLESFERICKGGRDAGPLGELPVSQRFRWLSATRSTVVQVSKVHTGLCKDSEAKLEQLFGELVLEPV
jgi:DUF3037 family protein